MLHSVQARLGLFVLAIGASVLLIFWGAHTSARRVDALREHMTVVHLDSFRIADHFQQSLLRLNNTLFRFGIHRDTNVWAQFVQESDQLNRWIDLEAPKMKTLEEKRLLSAIDAAYDDYLAAARQVQDLVFVRGGRDKTLLLDFERFERETDRLLTLGYQLANAHRESLNAAFAESHRSLKQLATLLFGALVLLLALGGGLAVVIYRGLISPLRLQLVKSRALLERQEKLASLGLLAAGLAHEIRNPLTAIKARLFTQQKLLRSGSPEHGDAAVIGGEINRLEKIVKDFLQFARPSEPELVEVPADQALREVQALMAPQLEKAGIRLSVEAAVQTPVRLDRQQIKQVLLNLIQNAAESIGHDGVITLRTRLGNAPLGDRTVEVVILEVQDTGKGIPAEVQKRLFDPFFTTKEGGTGLGLSIASRVVEKHGGALQYQTRVNAGTTFGIVLPIRSLDEADRQNPAR